MNDGLTIKIPGCPHKDLSSNTRAHWRAKAREVKQARYDAKMTTWGTLCGRVVDWDQWTYTVNVTIGWGKGRKCMDPTNLWSCVKPHIDGVADAMEVDDKHFAVGSIAQVRAGKDEPGGYVEITLEVIA